MIFPIFPHVLGDAHRSYVLQTLSAPPPLAHLLRVFLGLAMFQEVPGQVIVNSKLLVYKSMKIYGNHIISHIYIYKSNIWKIYTLW